MLLSLLAARAKPTVAKKAKAPAKVQPGSTLRFWLAPGPCDKLLNVDWSWPGASEAKVPIRDYLVSEEVRNRSGYPDKSFCIMLAQGIQLLHATLDHLRFS